MPSSSSTFPTRSWRLAHSEASCGWGGQEHRVLAELRGFQRRGHSAWIIAEANSQVLQRAAAEGVQIKPVVFKKTRMAIDAVHLAAWLRRERIDILNTHSSRDGWLLGIAGRLANVPLLIRSRHIDVDYRAPWISRHAFTTFADHVLTTSDKITAHFQEIFHLPSDRITTLPTGIDVQRFHPDGPKAELVPEQPGLAGTPVAGMVSVLRSWKGHPVFFEAARRLRDAGKKVRFVVVGGGAPVERFEALAADHGAGGLVHFTGHREDVPEVLRGLDVLVIPSTRHEGVPQIGLQALACGTPVVGSACGGIPEIIREGETGRIVPIGDAGALAERIDETLTQAEATRTMAANGRQLAEARFSLDAMLDRLEEIYRRHIGR